MSQDQHFMKYRTILRLMLEDHLSLVDSWSNPFIPVAVFRDQVRLVDQWLASPSATYPTPTLQAQANTPAAPSTPGIDGGSTHSNPPYMTSHDFVDPGISPTHRTAVGPEGSFCDDRKSDENNEEDGDDEVEIVGKRIALQDVIDDNTSLDDAEDMLRLVWEIPETLRTDATLWAGVKRYPFISNCGAWSSPRSIRSTSRLEYTFGTVQLACIDCSDRWLDDELVNGCAVLLQQAFQTQDVECAILSSHVIPQLLRNTDSSTDAAWQYNRGTQYWRKPVWILPIHDQTAHHWALAVVRVDTEEIHLFDSFGQRSLLSEWLPVRTFNV
ncbi:hypothetical protein PM082_023161 [Marasmius tenuissimus]|nr:hypothetical protein PM082_023161 [Marasmius tenuissimus]